MKLIGYVRVSTAAQEDNTSLDEQERSIRAYCDLYKHKLVKVYREVKSGGNMDNREEFQKAVEAMGKADGLIAFKLDRVARNTYDVLHLVNKVMKPAQKELILVMDQVDTTTPNGRFFLTIMAAMGELEKDTIYHRMQTGRKAKANAGGFAFGSPRYGFKSVDGELVQHPEEYPVLQFMKNHRRAGKGLTEIANMLNELGHRTKRGGKWTPVQVGEAVGKYKRGRTNKGEKKTKVKT